MNISDVKIFLIDKNAQLTTAWNEAFAACPNVFIRNDDYFCQPADVITSPANSFGIMDGGLDLAIRDRLGQQVETQAQRIVDDFYHGEMPIGCADLVKIDNKEWPYMAIVPTMRIPENVAGSLNAYMAFRALLLNIENFNNATMFPDDPQIFSLVCSGLCTGTGQMPYVTCAKQMRMAYDQVASPPPIRNFRQILRNHARLINL